MILYHDRVKSFHKQFELSVLSGIVYKELTMESLILAQDER